MKNKLVLFIKVIILFPWVVYLWFVIKRKNALSKKKISVFSKRSTKDALHKVFKKAEFLYNYKLHIEDHFFDKANTKNAITNVSDGPFLIVSNHQSSVDISAVITALNKRINFRFISDIALENNRLLKHAYALLQPLFFDQAITMSGIQVIRRAVDLIKNKKTSIFVFPEGKTTFSSQMEAFNKNSFSIAHITKIPILPITIMNSDGLLLSKQKFRKTIVKMIIHKPVSYQIFKNYTLQKTATLIKKIIGCGQLN